jgi:carbonic anhydrase/acetyltransferase-like protein (isoleucine patch superfamily)
MEKGKEVFIADTARVFGKVFLGDQVSVWFGAVIRGDADAIHIGKGSNIQDTAVIHADPGYPCSIGEGVTVGHGAIVHGCTIANDTLIGMRATLLNGAKIGRGCIIGANSLVTEGQEIPDFSLVVGSPAKVIRQLDENSMKRIQANARHYVKNAKDYQENKYERIQ